MIYRILFIYTLVAGLLDHLRGRKIIAGEYDYIGMIGGGQFDNIYRIRRKVRVDGWGLEALLEKMERRAWQTRN